MFIDFMRGWSCKRRWTELVEGKACYASWSFITKVRFCVYACEVHHWKLNWPWEKDDDKLLTTITARYGKQIFWSIVSSVVCHCAIRLHDNLFQIDCRLTLDVTVLLEVNWNHFQNVLILMCHCCFLEERKDNLTVVALISNQSVRTPRSKIGLTFQIVCGIVDSNLVKSQILSYLTNVGGIVGSNLVKSHFLPFLINVGVISTGFYCHCHLCMLAPLHWDSCVAWNDYSGAHRNEIEIRTGKTAVHFEPVMQRQTDSSTTNNTCCH